MGFGDDEDSSRKRKALSLIDDAAMEDDDADDDEEDDDDDTAPHRRYNRRGIRFIEEEVAVDNDDDVEDDAEDAEDIDAEDFAEVEASAKPSHYRRYESTRELPEDVERLEALIKERYRTVDYTQDATVGNQQSLVPNRMDPKLWVIQCRPGYERSLCLQLLNKYVHLQSKGTPLLIMSAISLDHLKGYLYVEAEKESHVAEAISGIRHVFHTKGIKLVPLKEMVAAITPNRAAKMPIEVGSWVRIRSGPYAHDLARVVHVDHAHQKIDLKVVPRIDFVELLERQEGRSLGRKRDPFGQRSKIRTVAKSFSSEECRSLGLVVERRRGPDGEVYMAVGSYLFQDGYLIKTMSTRSIVVEDAAPFDEIQAFEGAADAGHRSESLPGDVSEPFNSKKHGLFKGDSVRVLGGDMMGMTGTVMDLHSSGKIIVKMDSRDVKVPVPFTSEDITKRFELGDHVCVREGMHAGQMGMVIKMEGRKCLILSDVDKSEFWALAKDLSLKQDVTIGHETVGDYEVEDCIHLQDQQPGVIVFADRAFCTVLLAAGSPEKPEIVSVAQQKIVSRCDVRRNATLDKHGNKVTSGDIVEFRLGGISVSGTAKYVLENSLFVKVKDRMEHLGYVFLGSKRCSIRGGIQTQYGSYGSGARYGGFRGRSRGRSFLRGRERRVMVKIIRGAHRGYRGRIVGETASHVRVELDAGTKIVVVNKDGIEQLDGDAESFGRSTIGSWSWNQEPTVPPKTPYGEHHPPTTPYLTTKDVMTSPKYTPVRPPLPGEREKSGTSDSDDDMRFAEGDQVTLPPKAPAVQPESSPDGCPPELKEEELKRLDGVPVDQIQSLVVMVPDGGYGVTIEVEKGICLVERVDVKDVSDERSFVRTGMKERRTTGELKLPKPQKQDWVRVLDGMFVESVGLMIAVDGNDHIVRLDDGQVMIFKRSDLAVTLPS